MALQDKTEAATPRRREEARDEGKVAKSADINSAVTLLVSLLVVKSCGGYFLSGLTEMARDTWTGLRIEDLNVGGMPRFAADYGIRVARLILPFMLAIGGVGLTVNVLQVGFKITPKSLAPNFSRIDPFKGIVRLFSARSAVELGKSIIKVSVVTYFVFGFLRSGYPALLDLAGMPPVQAASNIGLLCWNVLMRACVVMLVIGILDYIYQRFEFERNLKMTKQEVKEEFKRSEGDPHVKSAIRQRQREMGRRRMMQDAASADVVVTNPTHYAVALKYDAHGMSAPKVVAKGQRLLALKIRSIAEANGVPIVENPPVARMLYKSVEVGDQIPDDLYQAVAEILAYVYQLNKKAGGTAA